MKIISISSLLLVLVLAQCCCYPPPPPPVKTPVITSAPTEPPAQSIGTITNEETRVWAGSSANLQEIDYAHTSDLQNHDGVKVANGGKGRLEFPGIVLYVYNESDMANLTKIEVDQPNSAPIFAIPLVRGALSGSVSPGGQLNIPVRGNINVTVFGTRFFIVVNEANGFVTIGKFDGRLSVEIPGRGVIELGTEMVDISSDNQDTHYLLPFSYEDFDRAATTSLFPIDGINILRERNKLPPQGQAMPGPKGNVWLSGGCDTGYNSGTRTQVMAKSDRDGRISIQLGETFLWSNIPAAAGQTSTFDWTIPDQYGNQVLSLYIEADNQFIRLAQCQIYINDATPPLPPTPLSPGTMEPPPEKVCAPVLLNWDGSTDASGIQYYYVSLESCDFNWNCSSYKDFRVPDTSIDITNEFPQIYASAPYFRWTVFAVDNFGNKSAQLLWLYIKHFCQ